MTRPAGGGSDGASFVRWYYQQDPTAADIGISDPTFDADNNPILSRNLSRIQPTLIGTNVGYYYDFRHRDGELVGTPQRGKLRGEKGDKGDRGEPGTAGGGGGGGTGPQGPRGFPGVQGNPGPEGPAGPDGPAGPRGLQGEKGDPGESSVPPSECSGVGFARGIDADGEVVCRRLTPSPLGQDFDDEDPALIAGTDARCPPGQFIYGIDTDGRFLCWPTRPSTVPAVTFRTVSGAANERHTLGVYDFCALAEVSLGRSKDSFSCYVRRNSSGVWSVGAGGGSLSCGTICFNF